MRGRLRGPALAARRDAHPRRGVAILTCMDPRLEPERILGLQPGDATVIRNAGGAVTDGRGAAASASRSAASARARSSSCTTPAAPGRRPGGRASRAETALHDAVEALRHDARLLHRDRVSGALYDTVGRGVAARPAPGDRERQPPRAPRRREAPSPHRGEGPTAARAPRCAWCGRPFGGVGTGPAGCPPPLLRRPLPDRRPRGPPAAPTAPADPGWRGTVSAPGGCSSVGRASASQAEGRGFEPRRPLLRDPGSQEGSHPAARSGPESHNGGQRPISRTRRALRGRRGRRRRSPRSGAGRGPGPVEQVRVVLPASSSPTRARAPRRRRGSTAPRG